MKTTPFLRLVPVLLAVSLATAVSWGQDGLSGGAVSYEENPIFYTDTKEVVVPTTVLGPKGEYVSGLEKVDFKIYDNDKEQTIGGFEVSFLPISMVICVQSSARIEGILPDVKKTAILFTEMVLGEFGQAAIIAFDNRVRLMSDFTGDTNEIDKALNAITIGSEAVRLSDAVYDGIRMLIKRPANHRKVIVVVSESQNNGSETGLGHTLRTAQLNDIMIYPVQLSTVVARLTREPELNRDPIPPGVSARPTVPGQVFTPTTQWQHRIQATPNVIPIIIDLVRGVKNLVFSDPLEVLARGTGGERYAPKTSDGLQEAIAKVGEDLRSQYLLSYRPNNLNEGGIFHSIRVETNYKELEVRARVGYFYGPNPVPVEMGGAPVAEQPAKP
jgi:VWFA-related protein